MPEGMDLGYVAFPDHYAAPDTRQWTQAIHYDHNGDLIQQWAPTNRYSDDSVIGHWAKTNSPRMRLYYEFGYVEYRKVPKPTR